MYDRESQIRDEMQSVLAKIRVLEFALLEVLGAVPRCEAPTLAHGLRARVNEWALDAGSEFTPAVDEMASAQLSVLLESLGDAPTIAPQHVCAH